MRICSVIAFLGILVAPVWTAKAADAAVTEAQVKAGFLYNCARFVQWPASAEEFVIGVVGAEGLHAVLENMRGQRINGRPIRVKPVGPADDLRGYHILFIGGDEPRIAGELLARVGDAPVLTIGEARDFTSRGGVVRLYTERQRLRFEINMKRVEHARLHVSAKMLGLAKIVR